jgi:P4 family phage/plasmid primase-like protien
MSYTKLLESSVMSSVIIPDSSTSVEEILAPSSVLDDASTLVDTCNDDDGCDSSSISSDFNAQSQFLFLPKDAKVFALKPGYKRPLGGRGHLDAVPFAEYKGGPDFGIALDRQYILIDVDEPDNVPKWLLDAIAASPTWTQKTRKGTHYLYLQPAGFVSICCKLPGTGTSGVSGDAKHKGYFVGPGSMVNREQDGTMLEDFTYTVLDSQEPVPAPQWALDIFTAGLTAGPTGRAPEVEIIHGEKFDYVNIDSVKGDAAKRLTDRNLLCSYIKTKIDGGIDFKLAARDALKNQKTICKNWIKTNPFTFKELLNMGVDWVRKSKTKESKIVNAINETKNETTTNKPESNNGSDFKFEFDGTDHDNAILFTQMAKGRFLFCEDMNSWFVYDGTRWHKDSKEEATQLGRRVTQEMARMAAAIEDPSRMQSALKIAARSANRNRIDAMVALAKGTLLAKATDFDTNPDVLNVLNGTLDLRTGELLPHNPADLHSKIAPVMFDPSAKAPRWGRFLREVHLKVTVVNGVIVKVADEEGIAYFQRFMGYSATGHTKEQAMLLCWGEDGENGKSTEDTVLSGVLGDEYAITLNPAVILASKRSEGGPNSSIVRLCGARLVSLSENDSGTLNLATFKRLTGSDIVPAEEKYGKAFEFKPTHKIKMQCNALPTVTDTNNATWSRLHTLPYIAKFPRGSKECNTSLGDELAAEATGILNWILAGSQAWYANRLGKCESVTKANQQYREDQDPLTPFVDDCYTKLIGGRVKGSEMYAQYKSWVATNGMETMSSKEFHKGMMRTFVRKPLNGIETYRDLVRSARID